MKKLVNAKTFVIPCMRAGLCQYEDERVNVPQASLEKMAQTAFGIPLIIDHVDQSELENQLDQVVCGRVADMHYDTDTDLWMAHCVVETEEAIQKLESGWGVSTSYEVVSKGAGGTLNAVDFDATIEDGKYLHLAIVEHPRYEMAVNPKFYNSRNLQSTKPSLTLKESIALKGVSMFRLFRTKSEEVKENSSEMEIEVDGEKVALNELVQAYKQAKAQPVDVEHVVMQEDEEEKMNAEVDALLAEVEKEEEVAPSIEIEVEAPEKEEEKEVLEQLCEVEENEKEEEKEEKEQMKDEEEKMNSLSFADGLKQTNERFNALKQASFKSIMDNGASGYQTIHERAALGRSRYGTKK